MAMEKPSEDPSTTRYTLEKEHEFRFEVDFGEKITIQVNTDQ